VDSYDHTLNVGRIWTARQWYVVWKSPVPCLHFEGTAREQGMKQNGLPLPAMRSGNADQERATTDNVREARCKHTAFLLLLYKKCYTEAQAVQEGVRHIRR